MMVHHESTAAVVAIISALLDVDAWVSTSTLAATTDLQRDTVRRICCELAEHGWVQRTRGEDGSDRWMLGLRLPQIGLTVQARLVRRAEALRRDFDQLTAPLTTHQENPQ